MWLEGLSKQLLLPLNGTGCLFAFFDHSFVSVLPVGILLLQDLGQKCFGKAASGIWVGDKVATTDLRVFCDSVCLLMGISYFVQ